MFWNIWMYFNILFLLSYKEDFAVLSIEVTRQLELNVRPNWALSSIHTRRMCSKDFFTNTSSFIDFGMLDLELLFLTLFCLRYLISSIFSLNLWNIFWISPLCINYISPTISTQLVKFPVLYINVCLCDLSALCKSEL